MRDDAPSANKRSRTGRVGWHRTTHMVCLALTLASAGAGESSNGAGWSIGARMPRAPWITTSAAGETSTTARAHDVRGGAVGSNVPSPEGGSSEELYEAYNLLHRLARDFRKVAYLPRHWIQAAPPLPACAFDECC